MPRPEPLAYRAPSLAEHFAPEGPKRILALDGGGVRGILTLGILERVETLLRQRHGDDPAFRLCDYFDLIAGTSTGSIIAALLARGCRVAEAIRLYEDLADTVFARRWWRQGVLLPRYDRRALVRFLRQELDFPLGDRERLRTGLLVVTKRIDTGSPWPIGNNPFGRYFQPRTGNGSIPNSDYPVWKVVRASTAAPTFFAPEWIEIARRAGAEPVRGNFVDGGVSPHNNPALQAYLHATLRGFGLRWPGGADRLLIVSVGTGRLSAERAPSWISLVSGVTALQSLMDDCSALVEGLLQGMGACAEPRRIDAELGDLSPHELLAEPRFRYLRCDVKLHRDPRPRDGIDDDPLLEEVLGQGPGADRCLARMGSMDDPRPLRQLLALGRRAGEAKLRAEHFPAVFDLPRRADSTAAAPEGRRAYRSRPGRSVQAIRLTLATEGLRYRKWGALQTAKQGDWIVDTGSDVYTVDGETFARTYRPVGDGRYEKHSTVWAVPATADGVVPTKEGETHYRAGDYLVCNQADGGDTYAVPRAKFEQLYEPAEEG
ncbi:MAG: patatin-like phospholipase family protein [Synechococcaceae cyanobacterium]|nr:patatin-like phospholipase family protein [Synechococcaceae cyanobacterium]